MNKGIFTLAVSTFLLLLTALKPNWFWDHPKTVVLRSAIGNMGTAAFYYAIALFGLALGIFQLSH
jgi:hypothetical protein